MELSMTKYLLNLTPEASVLKSINKIFVTVMKREKSSIYSSHMTPMVLKMIKYCIQCLV